MPHRFASLVFWFDPSLIHPDDLETLTQMLCPAGMCFTNYEELMPDGEYRTILIEGQTYRIKSSAIKEYPPTKFVRGQAVRTLNGTLRTGWIRAIEWHYKHQRHIYLLEVEGVTLPRKALSRYYWEDDVAVLE